MVSPTLHFSLSFAALIPTVLSVACQPRALSLPFKNSRIANGADTRGILWQIGGRNPTNVTLVPGAGYNDTYVWGPDFGLCPVKYNLNATLDMPRCVTYRGGTYDPTNSGTDTNVEDGKAHGFDETIANWTKDDISLQDNTALPQYEFAIYNSRKDINSTDKGQLGLGVDSTLLKSLAASQKISSKAYSFFWGSEVAAEPRDGSLIIGGYDEAIVGEGPNLTVPMTQDARCKGGMIVSLTGLDLQLAGGSLTNAWDGLGTLRVCITASASNVLAIPSQYWDPIERITGVQRYPDGRNGTSWGTYYNTTLVKPQTATYSGGMSIRINGNFTVSIPHDQFIFGEHYIDGPPNPPLTRSKTDVSQIPIVRLQPGDDTMPSIGGMLFSSAYLVVNHDKKEFTITQAQTKQAPPKILAFDTANNCLAAIDPTEAPPRASTTGSSSSLSAGTIAGIVVGVVAGILVIALAAFVLKKHKRTTASPYAAEVQGINAAPPIEKYRYTAADDAPIEMYADDFSHELVHGDHRQFAVEMNGSERPHDVPEIGRMSPREASVR